MLNKVTWAVIACMNAAAFLLMGEDKRRARKGLWRISERTLFLFAALMGGLGATLGMHVFRHKTKHWYFRWGLPALAAAQAALLLWQQGLLG